MVHRSHQCYFRDPTQICRGTFCSISYPNEFLLIILTDTFFYINPNKAEYFSSSLSLPLSTLKLLSFAILLLPLFYIFSIFKKSFPSVYPFPNPNCLSHPSTPKHSHHTTLSPTFTSSSSPTLKLISEGTSTKNKQNQINIIMGLFGRKGTETYQNYHQIYL